MPTHRCRSSAHAKICLPAAPKLVVQNQCATPMHLMRCDGCSGDDECGAVLRLSEVLTCEISFAWALSLAYQLVENADVELRMTISRTYSMARDMFYKVANLTLVYSKVLVDIRGQMLPDLFTSLHEQDLLGSLRLSRMLLSATRKMRKGGERVQDDMVLVVQNLGNVIVCGELSCEFGLLPEVGDSIQKKINSGADSRHGSIYLLKMAICQLEVAQNELQTSQGVQCRVQNTLRILVKKERALEQLVSKLEAATLATDLTSPMFSENVEELTVICKSLAEQYRLCGNVEQAKCVDLFRDICGAMDDITTLTK